VLVGGRRCRHCVQRGRRQAVLHRGESIAVASPMPVQGSNRESRRVEGNTTFYATPSPATVARWAELAPAGFRFCFKLPREITHDRKLRDTGPLLVGFVDRIAPLAGRLGPLQIQLPASFGPEDLPVLASFLDQLPGGLAFAVEVRHRAFFAGGESEGPLDAMLEQHQVDRVILDSRALFATPPTTPEGEEAWQNKPRLPVRPHATAGHPIVRLIGELDADRNLELWRSWVPKLAGWLAEGREPFVFTHTPDNVAAPDLARRFWQEVCDTVDGLAPLPVPQRSTSQLDLWALEDPTTQQRKSG